MNTKIDKETNKHHTITSTEWVSNGLETDWIIYYDRDGNIIQSITVVPDTQTRMIDLLCTPLGKLPVPVSIDFEYLAGFSF